MGEVKCFMLKGTAQSLMGEFCDAEDDFHYVVKHPVMIMLIPPRGAEDSLSVSFIPFLQFTEEFKTGVTFSRADVSLITTPIADLRNQYSSIFGSGIVLASSLKS